MFAIASIATTPTSLALTPSVLGSSAPADAVSTRQTPAAVTAPLNNLALTNDAKGSAPAASANNNVALAGTSSNDNTLSSDSTTFLTQLISQYDDSTSGASSAAAASFTPAPVYDTLVEYSFVKFKPSLAGLSDDQANSPAASAPTPEPSQSAPAVKTPLSAYSSTQARNQTNLESDNQPQVNFSG